MSAHEPEGKKSRARNLEQKNQSEPVEGEPLDVINAPLAGTDRRTRRGEPWQMSGGLLSFKDLKHELKTPADIGRLGHWRIKFSILELQESKQSELSKTLKSRGFSKFTIKELAEHGSLIKYSPILELPPLLREHSQPFYQFENNARMFRQSWTDIFAKGPNYQLWQNMLGTAEDRKVVAHGTWGNFSSNTYSSALVRNHRPFQQQWALLAIMYDGAVKAGDGGLLQTCSDAYQSPLNAADYGPYYVIFKPNYRNVSMSHDYCGFSDVIGEGHSKRGDHLAYLIPDETFRPFFSEGVRHLVAHGHLSKKIGKLELEKILTYQEWIDRGKKLVDGTD